MLTGHYRFLRRVRQHTHPDCAVRVGYVHDRDEDRIAGWAKCCGFIETQRPARGWRITEDGRRALAEQAGGERRNGEG